MTYDFSLLMKDPTGTVIPWKPNGVDLVPWKIGDAMANAICSPNPTVKSAFSARLKLADRLAECGKGELSTDDRIIILEAVTAVYGPTMPVVAGRIEQFMDLAGPYAPEPEKKQ